MNLFSAINSVKNRHYFNISTRIPTTMKNLTLIFLCATLVSGCNQPGRESAPKNGSGRISTANIPAFNADSAYSFVKAQVDFGPRVPNLPAHKQCADYLSGKMRSYTANVTVQQGSAAAFDGTILNFRNIIGSFGPAGNNRILLGAHWDSRPFADHDPDPANFNTAIDGANDGASGVGVLLEIARQLHISPPPVGVDIIFFDAEDYGPPKDAQTYKNSDKFWGLGSQHWAKSPHISNYFARYGILLDMVGAADATFLMEGVSMDYASSVVKKVWDIGNQIGYSSYFIYERGVYITDDHYYVIRFRNIPMIDIIHLDHTTGTGFNEHWHTVSDNIGTIDRNTLKAVGQTVLTVIFLEK
jgi:hypothetical protein